VTEAIRKVWQLIIWEKWVKGNCAIGLRAIRDGGYSESVAVDYSVVSSVEEYMLGNCMHLPFLQFILYSGGYEFSNVNSSHQGIYRAQNVIFDNFCSKCFEYSLDGHDSWMGIHVN
jgi:hypothetical protein